MTTEATDVIKETAVGGAVGSVAGSIVGAAGGLAAVMAGAEAGSVAIGATILTAPVAVPAVIGATAVGAVSTHISYLKAQFKAAQEKKERELRIQQREIRRIKAAQEAEQKQSQALLKEKEELILSLSEQQREKEKMERKIQKERKKHQGQLRQSQISSLNELKNGKSAEIKRIIKYELAPVQTNISMINDQILMEEKELYKFSAEINDKSHKTVVLIGMTGDGKSTFGNRLCGDTSLMADTGPFTTSNNNKSCTAILQKHIYGKLSVIDCPGWGDTDYKDRSHTNNLCQYLRGCGGINAFVVVRNGTNCRFDAHFQKQLKYLEKVFGDKFWKNLIVVLTRIDKGIAEIQFKKSNKAQQIKEDVSKLCIGSNNDVDVITIGLNNYANKLKDFINKIPQNRFECVNIKSPINDLKLQRKALVDKETTIQQRIKLITNEINEINALISDIKKSECFLYQ